MSLTSGKQCVTSFTGKKDDFLGEVVVVRGGGGGNGSLP